MTRSSILMPPGVHLVDTATAAMERDWMVRALDERRVALGLSLTDVADRAGIHQATVAAWLRGRRQMTTRQYLYMATILGLKVEVSL